jgi:ABC-type dipeptide/oligopeptide/nickel transport system permease component
MLGEKASDAVCTAFSKRYGLDQPPVVRFGYYLGRVLAGDLGEACVSAAL